MTEIPHSAQLNGFTCADMCHVRYALAFMRRPRATMPQLRPACRRAPPGPRARSRLATVPRVREQLHRCAVPASRRRLTACPAAPSSCRAPPRQRRAAAGRACSCCSPRPETPHAGCMRQQQRDTAQPASNCADAQCQRAVGGSLLALLLHLLVVRRGGSAVQLRVVLARAVARALRRHTRGACVSSSVIVRSSRETCNAGDATSRARAPNARRRAEWRAASAGECVARREGRAWPEPLCCFCCCCSAATPCRLPSAEAAAAPCSLPSFASLAAPAHGKHVSRASATDKR